MAILETFEKQPNDVQDYDIDFSAYITGSGELLTDAHTAAITIPAGISQSAAHQVNAGVVKVWLAGGTDGEKYKITVALTTPVGRVHEVEIMVKVKET